MISVSVWTTGLSFSQKLRPEYLSFSEEFFGGADCSLEVKVKMIYDSKQGDIISQYIHFTKIYDEQVRIYGRTQEAVLKAIRICKDQNVLKEYLTEREQEVVDIMMKLFDDEYILKTYIESERRDAAETATEKTIGETAKKLYQKGHSVQDIADLFEVSAEQVEQWLEQRYDG